MLRDMSRVQTLRALMRGLELLGGYRARDGARGGLAWKHASKSG